MLIRVLKGGEDEAVSVDASVAGVVQESKTYCEFKFIILINHINWLIISRG
jgi:hypothetical protein